MKVMADIIAWIAISITAAAWLFPDPLARIKNWNLDIAERERALVHSASMRVMVTEAP